MTFRRKVGNFDLERLLEEDSAEIPEEVKGESAKECERHPEECESPAEDKQPEKEDLAEKIGEILGYAAMGAGTGMLLRYILGI